MYVIIFYSRSTETKRPEDAVYAECMGNSKTKLYVRFQSASHSYAEILPLCYLISSNERGIPN